MKKITFVIDLDRCIGCHGCQISCKMENGVGLGACRNEVKDIGPTGTYPDIQLYFLPAMCQHCDNPACVKVCPEHALKLVEHDASNLVVVDPEAEEKAAQKAKAHEEAQKVKAEAKAKLDKMLDQVEKLAD